MAEAEGADKRKAEAEPDEAGSKRPNNKDWCAACWEDAGERCRAEAHRLLSVTEALAQADAAFQEAQRAVGLARERMDAVLKRQDRDAPVLELELEESNGGKAGWDISGGTLELALCCGDAGSEELRSLCKALENTEITYLTDDEDPPIATWSLEKRPFEKVFAQLPPAPKEHMLKAGTILVCQTKAQKAGKSDFVFRLYFSKIEQEVESKWKLLGRVIEGLSSAELSGCWGKGCRNKYCYCSGNLYEPTTTIVTATLQESDG